MTCTLVSDLTGDHITLRLRCRNKKLKGYVNLEHAAIVTADVPRSRNEDGSYTDSGDRVGWFHPGKQEWIPNKGSDPARFRALLELWHFMQTAQKHPQIREIKVEALCGRCGRPLNDPISIDRGEGPDCYGERTGSHHQRRTKEKV